jgi:hypothetical protein
MPATVLILLLLLSLFEATQGGIGRPARASKLARFKITSHFCAPIHPA